mmetsp:Transcript_496/g.612  ORF Transcript_496/g.612 Transcript_496/m.612 type:complete len:120 (-) Transcript_496:1044-1403(-)
MGQFFDKFSFVVQCINSILGGSSFAFVHSQLIGIFIGWVFVLPSLTSFVTNSFLYFQPVALMFPVPSKLSVNCALGYVELAVSRQSFYCQTGDQSLNDTLDLCSHLCKVGNLWIILESC